MTEAPAEAKVAAIEDVIAVLDALFPEEKTSTDFIAWLTERKDDIERREGARRVTEEMMRMRWEEEREHRDIVYHLTHKRYEDL